jgi:hypothetical protein
MPAFLHFPIWQAWKDCEGLAKLERNYSPSREEKVPQTFGGKSPWSEGDRHSAETFEMGDGESTRHVRFFLRIEERCISAVESLVKPSVWHPVE